MELVDSTGCYLSVSPFHPSSFRSSLHRCYWVPSFACWKRILAQVAWSVALFSTKEPSPSSLVPADCLIFIPSTKTDLHCCGSYSSGTFAENWWKLITFDWIQDLTLAGDCDWRCDAPLGWIDGNVPIWRSCAVDIDSIYGIDWDYSLLRHRL